MGKHVRETSLKAYRAILNSGLLSKMRMVVYKWLYHHGPATAGVVESEMGSKDAHKRLSELRDRGVVKELGATNCPISGKEVILWDVTSKLPRKLKKHRVVKYTIQVEYKVGEDPWGIKDAIEDWIRSSKVFSDAESTTVKRTVTGKSK